MEVACTWALRMLSIGAVLWEFAGERWNAVFGGSVGGDTLKETANIVAVRESREIKSPSFFIFLRAPGSDPFVQGQVWWRLLSSKRWTQ